MFKAIVLGSKETVAAFVELMAAAGISHLDEINRHHINRRTTMYQSNRYVDIFPYLTEGCLLHKNTIPESWRTDMAQADPHSFQPRFNQVFIEED